MKYCDFIPLKLLYTLFHISAVQPVISCEKEESQIQSTKEPEVCLPEKDNNKEEINVDFEEPFNDLQKEIEDENIDIEHEETGMPSTTRSEETNENVSSDEKTSDYVNEEVNRNIDSGIGDIEINQVDSNEKINTFYVNNEALISGDNLGVNNLDNTLDPIYDSVMTEPGETTILENVEEVQVVSNNNNDVTIPSAPPPSIQYATKNLTTFNTEQTATAPPISIPDADVACLNEDNSFDDNLADISTYAQLRPRLDAMIDNKKPLVKMKEKKAVGMMPFTEEQLNSFYYNHEIIQLDFFIDEFLKVRCISFLLCELCFIDEFLKVRCILILLCESCFIDFIPFLVAVVYFSHFLQIISQLVCIFSQSKA